MSKRMITTLLVILMLTACVPVGSNTPQTPTTGIGPTATIDVNQDPGGVAVSFLDAWEQGNYEGMYSLLAPNNQREYSAEEFISIYQGTATTIQQTAIDTVPLSELRVTDTTAQLAFRVTYTSAVLGDIVEDMTMNLIFAEGRWGIVWSPALIFPEMAGGNTLQLQVESPARANIYDRNGEWLVSADATTFTIQILAGGTSDEYEGQMLELLSSVLRMPPDQIRQNYEGLPDDWWVALGDVDAETLQANWSALSSYPALRWEEKTGRRYFDVLAPHVMGYTAFIPEDQLQSYLSRGYKQDDIVGLAGLELWGEEYLAGQRGGVLTAWTSTGEYFVEIASRDLEPAKSIYTTIDRELQAIVQDASEEAFRFSQLTWAEKAGGAAVVVLDVNNGDVLAMASYPYYDPNVFHPYNYHPLATDQYFQGLYADPRRPFLNRATQGLYPLGSVFKLVSASAVLGEGLYEPGTTYTCTGIWTGLGTDEANIRYDWKEGGHGTVDLTQAITGSCNPYFYQVGLTTGNKDFFILANYARQYGLGVELGIEIEEDDGQVPDPDWVWQNLGQQWTIADSVNLAIGQGAIQITPLQVAVMVAAVANGGTVYKPQLVDRVGLIGEEPVLVTEPVVMGRVELKPEHFEAIREGMRGVVSRSE